MITFLTAAAHDKLVTFAMSDSQVDAFCMGLTARAPQRGAPQTKVGNDLVQKCLAYCDVCPALGSIACAWGALQSQWNKSGNMQDVMVLL